jgi:hypothetical protein
MSFLPGADGCRRAGAVEAVDVLTHALAAVTSLLADLVVDDSCQRRSGPPQPVADEAPAIDRLVALLGRDPQGSLTG